MPALRSVIIASSCFSLAFSVIGILFLSLKAKNIIPVYKNIRAKEKTNENIKALRACKSDLNNAFLSIATLLVLLTMVIVNLITYI